MRRIFLKVKKDLPHLDDEIALIIAVCAMNDSLEPEGLVPSLLVFGMLPRIPMGSDKEASLKQFERMKAMSTALF